MVREISKYPYSCRSDNELKIFFSDRVCHQIVKVNYKNGQIFCTIKDRITSQNK